MKWWLCGALWLGAISCWGEDVRERPGPSEGASGVGASTVPQGPGTRGTVSGNGGDGNGNAGGGGGGGGGGDPGGSPIDAGLGGQPDAASSFCGPGECDLPCGPTEYCSFCRTTVGDFEPQCLPCFTFCLEVPPAPRP